MHTKNMINKVEYKAGEANRLKHKAFTWMPFREDAPM